MAEQIIGFVIICMVALIMIGLGVSQIRSKEPTGFYTGEKAPKAEEISDVKAWNRKHGMMWLFYGIAIICGYIVSAVIGGELSALFILCGIVIGALPIMMWYHSYLKKKYYN